jgi:hypothetical protein
LTTDGKIFTGMVAQNADSVDLQQALSGINAQALVASAEILERMAESGVAVKKIAPDLEQVIIRASSLCSEAFIRQNRGVQVSAFFPLDEEADLVLWIDHFASGGSLTGRPGGGAAVFVLDEWGQVAPVGVRGRLFKKPHNDATFGMVPLAWFGKWQSDGTLEIETCQFDTIELDAEELEELLQ